MYLFDDLRVKYPDYIDRINEAETFFGRLIKPENMPKVFNTEKENARLFYIGYDALKNGKLGEFNKCMAYYEQWLSYDADALVDLVPDDIQYCAMVNKPDYLEHKNKFFERVSNFLNNK